MRSRWRTWATLWHVGAGLAALGGTAIGWGQLRRAEAQAPRLSRTAPLPVLATTPRIAIIIPARDEAAHIARCVASLAGQRLAPSAIWAVDDHSTDATPSILQQLTRELPTLHPVTATERPPGWAGKNWALHLGMQAALAQGDAEWLLLTDADTVHHPELLWRAWALAHEMQVDLLTAMPAVVNERGDAMLVRAAVGEYYSFLYGADYPAHARDPHHPEAMAAGQFILVRAAACRDGLDRATVRAALDDDRAFVMAVKAAGYRVTFAYAQDLLQTQGYPTATAAWQGHSHHLAASVGSRAQAPHATAAWLATWGALSLPFVALVGAGLRLRQRGWRATWPALAQWGAHAVAISLTRARAARLARLPLWYVAAAPLSALVTQALLLWLLWQRLTGQVRVTWKQRRYS